MQNELNFSDFDNILQSNIFPILSSKIFKNHVFKNDSKVIEIVSKKLNFHQKTSNSFKNNSSSPTSTALILVFRLRNDFHSNYTSSRKQENQHKKSKG